MTSSLYPFLFPAIPEPIGGIVRESVVKGVIHE
jgi:hypothetical protein